MAKNLPYSDPPIAHKTDIVTLIVLPYLAKTYPRKLTTLFTITYLQTLLFIHSQARSLCDLLKVNIRVGVCCIGHLGVIETEEDTVETVETGKLPATDSHNNDTAQVDFPCPRPLPIRPSDPQILGGYFCLFAPYNVSLYKWI